MSLLQLDDVSLAFGMAPILDGVNFALEKGERVCLIGRNGEGKSSLLKLINGQLAPDNGKIIIQDGLTITMLAQDVPTTSGTVLDVVMDGDRQSAHWLAEYQRLSNECAAGNLLACTNMGALQQNLDACNGWDLPRRAHMLIERMGLAGELPANQLSGGKKRRMLLAQSLVGNPDVLLLDEPTNHLDIKSIAWLEQFLLDQPMTLLFITHDRAFMDKLATRIVELDRGKLSSYDISKALAQGNSPFSYYQDIKAQALAQEQKAFAEFDKKLAAEELWIRQGIKARRTRNEGRVRALKALRETRKARRDTAGQIAITQNNSDSSGKIVCTAENLSLSYADSHSSDDTKKSTVLVKNFSTVLMRGDKVGIIGANGAGKTTLIRTLFGLATDAVISGQVKFGTNVNIAFFDQLKQALDPEKSVAENVSAGSDFVEVLGKRKHILGYLQDFLFAPSRARTPVKALSGGEKARVLLAKNLLQPANVLVLDEPTNDLDMATLELLEEFLVQFTGTVLLISHDRSFMDNVVTQMWVFDKDAKGDGVVHDYIGGYSDFVRQHERFLQNQPATENTQNKKSAKAPANQAQTTAPPQKYKLSYKESQELARLPQEIAALENEQANLAKQLADGSWFASDFTAAAAATQQLADLETLLLEKLERWDSLDSNY